MTTRPGNYVAWYYSGTNLYQAPDTNITGISWSSGRQNITDQWYGGTCTVYGRMPSDLTYPPQIGQTCWVQILLYNETRSTSSPANFYGYISDYRVIYGTTPAYDTWEMTLETAWGIAGRKTGTVTVTTGQSTKAIVDAVASSLPFQITAGGGWSTTVSAQTFTGQLTNSLTTAMNTDGGFILESYSLITGGFSPSTSVQGHNNFGAGFSVWTFTDVPSDPSTYGRYSEIEFHSSAYNYGTQVTVQASGLADQSVGSGTYVQTYPTVNETTSQAQNVAGYYQAKFNLSTAVPFRISFTGAQQTKYDTGVLADTSYVGKLVTVKFRGNTYNCAIEGMSITANPTDWRADLYLSSSLQNAFLRLDSLVFGTLDNNRLGF